MFVSSDIMGLGKYAVLFVLFSLATATPSYETKRFRSDYEYNKKTKAFYKFHTETRIGYFVDNACKLEGANLINSPTYEDIVQVHGMLKRYPDLGPFVWIASDGVSHESVEEQPLLDLTPDSYEDASRFQRYTCDVLTTNGAVKALSCHNSLPFVCKVSLNAIPYDSRCDVYSRDYHYYAEVKSCYKITEIPLAWNEAYEECKAEGAHLVVINSEAEHDLIKNLTNSVTPARHSYHPWYFLAGFRAIKPSREFRTVFNQTLEQAGYSQWSYGEPNNAAGSEYCGSVFKEDGKLNDVNCINKYAFICEKEVNN